MEKNWNYFKKKLKDSKNFSEISFTTPAILINGTFILLYYKM